MNSALLNITNVFSLIRRVDYISRIQELENQAQHMLGRKILVMPACSKAYYIVNTEMAKQYNFTYYNDAPTS